MSPRGGNTVGAPLTLSDLPSVNWTKLKKSSDNKKQKDRLAILAMQGPYRASFDFIESVGYQNDYTPPRPYQSWGTEYVYVVDDDVAWGMLHGGGVVGWKDGMMEGMKE